MLKHHPSATEDATADRLEPSQKRHARKSSTELAGREATMPHGRGQDMPLRAPNRSDAARAAGQLTYSTTWSKMGSSTNTLV